MTTGTTVEAATDEDTAVRRWRDSSALKIVATYLLEGDFFVDQCNEDKMADPERIKHSRKVDFIAEPEILDIYEASVEQAVDRPLPGAGDQPAVSAPGL